MKQFSILIAGGGSTFTPGIILMLLDNLDKFPIRQIKMFDNDAERQAKVGDACAVILREKAPHIKFSYSTDPAEAFTDIDFVMAHIRVGKYPMRELDEKIPLKYGLVGQETCGPGGFAYGMRSLQGMKEMVEKVRSYSKDTWILNYTNPAAIVALGIDRMFPEDKRILNLCDQPYSLLKSYAKILEVPQETLIPKYFGLNHFGWFTGLKGINGNDYFDKLRFYLRDHDFKPFNAEQRDKSWLDTYVRVNKYMNYFDEYIPTTYLQYYMFPTEIVQESDPKFTRADEAKLGREKEVFETCKLAESKEDMSGIKMLTNSVFGKLMVEVAESIAYDLNNPFVVMVKNNGIIPNFPQDAIIEVDGTIGKDGAKGNYFGEISTFYKGLMENQYAYELLTVEAFMEKNYTKALQALTLNRTVVEPNKAKLVLDDLMEKNREYWYLD